uniref:Uncharacterized protein n=1 Tax=Parascaris equorum TaxID=6256 RepID=A0A914R9G7_PAREQ
MASKSVNCVNVMSVIGEQCAWQGNSFERGSKLVADGTDVIREFYPCLVRLAMRASDALSRG